MGGLGKQRMRRLHVVSLRLVAICTVIQHNVDEVLTVFATVLFGADGFEVLWFGDVLADQSVFLGHDDLL